jgi:hypothetical protein
MRTKRLLAARHRPTFVAETVSWEFAATLRDKRKGYTRGKVPIGSPAGEFDAAGMAACGLRQQLP